MVRLISRQRGGLAALKLTKLFVIDDFPAAKDSGKVLIIMIYCYLIIIIIIIFKLVIFISTLNIKSAVCLCPHIAKANHSGRSYMQSVVKLSLVIIKLQQYNNIRLNTKCTTLFN